jgi:hypothetical protein
VAFLDKGDVWVLAADGTAPRRHTNTRGKVEDFRFSPRGDYLAYAKQIRAHEERPICAIVIVDVLHNRIVREIKPSEGWIDIDKWLSTRLRYHASSGLEVSGWFEFDAVRRAGSELDPTASAHAFENDLSLDESLFVYVDDVGVGPTFEERLHLVDTASSADRVHVSKRSVSAPAIAPAKDAVAFIEVFGDGKAARDRLWVYRLADASLRMIDDAPVQPKSAAGSALTWSPDGRYLSVNFGSSVTVVDVDARTPRRTFRGIDACWSAAGTVVVGNTGGAVGLDAIDVTTGARRALFPRGTRPQCLP